MRRVFQFAFGLTIAALLIGGPLSFAYYRHSQVRNFRVVREGVLYRSGQMTLGALRTAIFDRGIKTVVTLRDARDHREPKKGHWFAFFDDRPDAASHDAKTLKDPPPDLEEESYCRADGINYFRIAPHKWWDSDSPLQAEESIRQFRAIMDNPKNYPVLIHCFAGLHRSGAVCAVYRMEYEHWTNAQAIAEMRACGYRDLEDEFNLLGFLEQYRPSWQREPAPAK